MKKYSVLICLLASVLFIMLATAKYPGGSLIDKTTLGFRWSENFFSNLFEAKAINGKDNAARIWAVVGMAFHSIAYGLFFIHMAKKVSSGRWAKLLRVIGFVNIVFIFLIATPLHDLGTISIALTLAGLFTITGFVFKTRLHFFKYSCVVCLLTYYIFFAFYGLGYLRATAIMQKVYVLCSMLLVLGLEYLVDREDFKQTKPVEVEGQTASR